MKHPRNHREVQLSTDPGELEAYIHKTYAYDRRRARRIKRSLHRFVFN